MRFFGLTALIYLGFAASPLSSYGTQSENPISMFVPGGPVIIENQLWRIDDRVAPNRLKGVTVHIFSKDWKNVTQVISAREGEVSFEKASKTLVVRLYDCVIEDKSVQDGENAVKRMYAKLLEFRYHRGKRRHADDR